MKKTRLVKHTKITTWNNGLFKFISRALKIFYYLPLVFRGLLFGPMVLILVIMTYQWFAKEYPSRPQAIVNKDIIQHPNYHGIATEALASFAKLPPVEQTSLIKNLNNNLLPLQQWLKNLAHIDDLILCLGESHRETTRQFLAEMIFADFKFNALYLEANEYKLNKIKQRLESSSAYFPLLNADVLALLRKVQQQNPLVDIFPIDVDKRSNETKTTAQQGIRPTRDDKILSNFNRHYTQQTRNIVLFGAMHCSYSATWFYGKLLAKKNQHLTSILLNARVFSEHEDGPIEAFVYFLDQVVPTPEHFVINDTRAFAAIINQWFPLTQKVTFKSFQSIIIYRH